jgi:NAD+ synthase (glutamine-hydrolysing)
MNGFFSPISGGLDSASSAIITYSMCRLLVEAVQAGNKQVINDVRRVAGEPEGSTWLPESPQELCGRIFYTCYMGTTNSSGDTRNRAKQLAKHIGATHTDLNIDSIINALMGAFTLVTGFKPRFSVHGGSPTENLALQNIQARSRMIVAYLFAQLLPLTMKRKGSLLVSGSANLSEQLRGYYTKYDCSSCDLNAIGSIDKSDLISFLKWAQTAFDLPIIADFIAATPTAELVPFSATYTQSDEQEMGMTYVELSIFGRLRKIDKCGPYGMFQKLLHSWGNLYSPREIYEKTRRFYYYYAVNRHKQVILTPSVHCDNYSCDDNRFDQRPILYPVGFEWQNRMMEEQVLALERRKEEAEAEAEGSGKAKAD